MANRIASGEIHIEVNDREAIASLERIDAEFDRKMREIDREKATVTIDADIKQLERKLAEAKRKIKDYDDDIAKAEDDRSKAALKGHQTRLKEDARETQQALENARRRRDAHSKEAAGLELIDKKIAAVTKRDEQRAKVEERSARKREIAQRREVRLRETNERAQLREVSAAERSERQRERELRQVPRLEQAYVRLHDRLEKINRIRRTRPRPDEEAAFRLDIEERRILSDIEEIRAKVQAVAGRDPIEIPVRAERATRWGELLRGDILRHQGNWMAVGSAVGHRMGIGTRDAYRDTLNRGLSRVAIEAGRDAVANVGRAAAMFGSRLLHAAGGLADSTIRLGPFTTTIRKAVIALSLFAPILLDVVGALGALTGSVGSATLGLGALGAAVAGGGIPVLLGMGIVIKQVATEFTNVMKAQKAYDDAIRKGNTELAATKMKELRATMGNVSKETVKNIGLARKLNSEWKDATEPARAAAFTTIGHAIRFASDMMPAFAARTNTAMQTAGQSINQMLARLSSAGGRSALFEMMDNFNASLGPVLDGLADVAAYLGRVGQIASRFLPTMANNFATWARNLNSVDTTTLTGKVNRTIDSLRALGRFLMAAGRLIKAFFGAGVDSGNDLLDVMTNAMTGWTNWMNTVEGQDSLHSFFSESIDGARTLWNTLQPVIASFVRWAAQIAPFARSFFDGAAAVGNLVSELLRLTGLSGSFAALATTLGALWAWGKIRTTAAAISAFVAGLTGQAAAETAAATAAGRNTVAQNAQAVATARSAEAATVASAAYSRLAVASGAASVAGGGAVLGGAATTAASASRWSRVGTAINGASMAMLGMRAATAGYVGVAALTAYAIYKMATATSKFEADVKSADMAIEQFHDSADQSISVAAALGDELLAGTLGLNSTALSLKQLRAQLKSLDKGSLAYKQTLNQIQQLEQQQGQQAQTTLDNLARQKKARDDAVLSAEEEVRSAKEKVRLLKEESDAAQKLPEWEDDLKREKLDDYNEALDDQKDALQHLTRTRELAALSYYNEQRGLAGLPELALTAARAFRQLEKAGGKQLATKVSLKYDDPNKAQRVGAAAARALKQGAGRGTVMKIIADSRSADQAIARLKAARITPKELRIIAKGGDEALAQLRKIVGVKLAPKVQDILASDRDAQQKIKALIRLGIPPKTAKILGDPRDAESDIRAVQGMKIANKLFSIIANTSSAVSGIHSVLNLIASVPRTVTTIMNIVRRHSPADGGVFASGGYASVPDTRQQDRAARTAELSGSAQRAISQKVNRPRYLVGEEATPEIVVSTNPAYRERNQKYAAMAARMVGLEAVRPDGTIAAAGGFGEFGPGDPGFNPTAIIKRKKKFHPRKKRKKAYKARRGWATYVANLEKQQGYWEREVSIRESQIREPEDMVIRAPEKDTEMKDPVTGDMVKVEAYKANPLIESQYKPDLQYVIDAMNTLMSIVRELVRAIPLAMQAAKQESNTRHDRIVHLNDEITTEKRKLRNADDEDKQKHQNRINKLTTERDRHEGIRDQLESDIKALRAARVEAGFDWREYSITRAAYRKERDEAYGIAEKQAEADTLANVPTDDGRGDGRGGGRDSDKPTLPQQMFTLSAAREELYRQFGSNYAATTMVGTAITSGMYGAGRSALPSYYTSGIGSGAQASGMLAEPSTAYQTAAGLPSPYTSGEPQSTGAAAGDTNIVINNSFPTPPPDPHIWSKGVEYELQAAL